MSKFQVGDEVRRIKRLDDVVWQLRCDECEVGHYDAVTVKACADGGYIQLEEIGSSSPTWDASYFELAFPKPKEPDWDVVGKEPQPTYAKQQEIIAELEQSSEMLRADLAGQNDKLQRLQEQFDGVCAQLEEARESAKQLGADLDYSYHTRRIADHGARRNASLLTGLDVLARDIDLDSTAAQLRDIAKYIEDLYNIADARVARRASNILLLLNITVKEWRRA